MNKGVELLLARMDSHPEEFVYKLGVHNRPTQRWAWVIDAVFKRVNNDTTELNFLTDEEVSAIYYKYTSLMGDQFTKQIMEALLVGDVQEEEKPRGRPNWKK